MSNNLDLSQVAAAQNQKEVTINDQAGELDAALTEFITEDVTSGNVTVTDPNYRAAIRIFVTGATVGGRTVTLPAIKRLVLVSSDGTNTQTFDLVVGSTTLTVMVGERRLVYTDGTANGLEAAGTSAAAETFLDHGDTPGSYSGQTDRAVKVNSTPDALEFVEWKSLLVPTEETGTTYTLALTDSGGIVRVSNASANTVTVPPNSSVAFAVGAIVRVTQTGAGLTTIAEGAGVTINSMESVLDTRFQYGTANLIKVATDVWVLYGVSEIGEETLYFHAEEMHLRSTANATLAPLRDTATNSTPVTGLLFDASTIENAYYVIPIMPKRWDGASMVRVRFFWTNSSVAGTGDVIWAIRPFKVRDGDQISTAGGVFSVTDTFQATDDLHVTDEVTATVGGTFAPENSLWMRVVRDASNGSDTYTQDAQLLGISIKFDTNKHKDN